LSSKRIQLFKKRHKLALQGFFLLIILLVPILLYGAAVRGDEVSLLILMAFLGLATACAMWVS